jgi:hypothetical protein
MANDTPWEKTWVDVCYIGGGKESFKVGNNLVTGILLWDNLIGIEYEALESRRNIIIANLISYEMDPNES